MGDSWSLGCVDKFTIFFPQYSMHIIKINTKKKFNRNLTDFNKNK